MKSLITALVRGGGARSTDAYAEITEERNLLVAPGAAPFSEATRQGDVWNCISAAGTPLVVIPTTLCILELFNQSGGVMEVQDLFLFHLLGTAVQHNQSIWACVCPPRGAVAPPALAASTVIGSQSGKMPYTATAGSPVVPAAGTTVVANGWRPWGTPGPGVISSALPGEAFSVPVDGKLLVPNFGSLAITCVDALATVSSVQVGASWRLIKPAAMALG